MKKSLITLLVIAVAIGTSPESLIRFDPKLDEAEAGFRGGGRGGGGARGGRGGGRSFGGGGRSHGGGGFGARPYQPPRGAKIPSDRVSRPSGPTIDSRPSRPYHGFGRPEITPPGGRPGIGDRPDGITTLPARPGGGDRPGIGERPPRPSHPIARPPGGRPPGWRPPGSRPPNWRPPHYDPPYYRPPHWYWGDYHWGPSWGWYFTGVVAGATLVYVATLPSNCEEVRYEDETLYLCNDVLYRSTYYQDEIVYEIVSDDSGVQAAAPGGGGGSSVIGLSYASPMMRGEEVRSLQRALVDAGYDVGSIDGSFGPGTDQALRSFQRDNGLTETGMVDSDTASALGF